MRIRSTLLGLLLFYTAAWAQHPENDSLQIIKDISFTNHLIGSEQFEDAIYFMNTLHKNTTYDAFYADTMNYLRGWAYYNLQQLDSANRYLLKVDQHSFTGKKSHFFAAYNSAYQGQSLNGQEILHHLSLADSQLIELRNFELSGIALLNRDFKAYKEQSKKFTYTFFSLSEAEKSLDKHYDKIVAYKPKSKALAGIMSAVIPGSGKIYAGKLGEGVSALFSNAILAGITIENYRKAGLNNYKTIFFGSLFSIFYLGNIYGSMVSVQVSKNEFNASYDKKILFDIHIPLRTIFN